MIRAVYFDAVGTVIHPDPAVADVYRRVAAERGILLPREEIAARIRSAFQRQETIDRANFWRTSEVREYQRWQTIVEEVFQESPQRKAIFQELYNWFAVPNAWSVYPAVPALLGEWKGKEIAVGLASNFDSRLRTIVDAKEELQPFRDRLLISSELGFRKPCEEFFRILIERSGLVPQEILFVGDDPINDYEGARRMGMQALLIDHRKPKLDNLGGLDNGEFAQLRNFYNRD